MAEYVDVALLKSQDFQDYSDMDVQYAIDHCPRADVVPRAEVERLEQILNSYALQYGTVKDQGEAIERIRREVAKEIFAEVRKIVTAIYNKHIFLQEL
jgi:hypothetical protein